jgi:hypothetical protein
VLAGCQASWRRTATSSPKVEHHAEVGDDAEAFDPLLHAYMTIVMNALQQGGTYLLDLNEEGEPYCPLCELEKYYPGQNGPDLWISTAAEEQLARARELKLVAGVQ